MSTVVEQIGSNPEWISCVILAPNQLQDYLPDVKIHVLQLQFRVLLIFVHGISTDHLEITQLMGRDARLDTLSVDYYVEIALLIDVPQVQVVFKDKCVWIGASPVIASLRQARPLCRAYQHTSFAGHKIKGSDVLPRSGSYQAKEVKNNGELSIICQHQV